MLLALALEERLNLDWVIAIRVVIPLQILGVTMKIISSITKDITVWNLEEKAWFGKRYSGEYHLADGYRHTSWLGKIKKATYVVNLGTNDDLGSSSRQIKGVGTIYQ